MNTLKARILLIFTFLVGVNSASLGESEMPTHLKTTLDKVRESTAYSELKTNPKHIIIADLSLPSTQKRLWLINNESNKILLNSLVAHGNQSGLLIAKHFSNRGGSHQSSIGVFTIGGSYQGKHGHSIKLHGLEPHINDNANSRHIVIHSASYVSNRFISEHGYIGRSWGCPALSSTSLQLVAKQVSSSDLLILYAPEKDWLEHSRFLH